MQEGYSIKINISEGLVEISGPNKEWVDSKMSEFAGLINTQKGGDSRSRAVLKGGPKPASNQLTKPKRKGLGLKAQKNPELAAKLTADVKNKLQQYREEREANFKSLPDQAAIIATFLLDELDWPAVDLHDMYTVYSVMGWRQPGNPASQLNNARTRNNYFAGITDGKYTLSHTGENYARHDSKAPAVD